MSNLQAFEFYLLVMSTIGYGLATLVYWRYTLVRRQPPHGWASLIALFALVLHVIWFGVRIIRSGHLPFYNGHEFAVSFALAVVVTVLWFEWLSKRRDLGAFALPVVLLMLGYAWTLPRVAEPLIPIFQGLTLRIHILSSVIAYACFTTTFAASCLYLLRSRPGSRTTDIASSQSRIDRIAFQVVVIGFPFMTVCVISGAIWADYVWGRYWTWDPKETWSLITWLFFAAYLHTRYQRGWQGRRAAILAIIGFLTILMNFIGVQFIYQYQETMFLS